MTVNSALPDTRQRTPSAAGPPPRSRSDVPLWAEGVTRYLDDFIRIPGTNLRFGLDAILGFVAPGVGDAATGVASVGLLFVALQRGLPRVVMARMILNLLIDAIVGMVPVLGDLFDLGWKANRKNLELIKRYEANAAARPGFADYALVALGILAVLLAIALPIVVASWLLREVIARF